MKKAWCVSDASGDYSEVVFAETRGKAKMMPDWWCEGDFTDLTANRAPAFDGLSYPVTGRQYIERGFWVPCSWCEATLYADDEPAYDKKDMAFCSADCLNKQQEAASKMRRLFKEAS